MKKIHFLLFAALFCISSLRAQAPAKAPAQKAPAAKTTVTKPAVPAAPITKIYTILIKGGHVIDPKNNIDGIMDIAIAPAQAAAGGFGGGSYEQVAAEPTLPLRLWQDRDAERICQWYFANVSFVGAP